MKEIERRRKFNEFTRLSQEGVSGTVEIARKLGVSINTVYNWRKRLPAKTIRIKESSSEQGHPLPDHSFSRFFLEQKNNRAAASFIEINIGNASVIRIPDHISPDILRVILEHSIVRG